MNTIRVGLISDTHGLLRPEAEEALAGVDRIIHAGDIGNARILEQLELIAPVTAIRGNNDTGDWAASIPETQTTEINGVSVYVLHDVNQLDIDPGTSDIRVIISGHSHRPSVNQRDGILFVNPGSAGPRRFTLPISVGYLMIAAGQAHAEIRILELAPAKPAKCTRSAR
jgi:putative phosphoesterase